MISFLYKILGLYRRFHLIDEKYKVIKHDVKIKTVPNVNDIIYFDPNKNEFYLVLKIMHYISKKQDIWIVVKKIDESIN